MGFRVDSEDHYMQARAVHRKPWIYPGFEAYRQSKPKSETESTSGSTSKKKFKTFVKVFVWEGM